MTHESVGMLAMAFLAAAFIRTVTENQAFALIAAAMTSRR